MNRGTTAAGTWRSPGRATRSGTSARRTAAPCARPAAPARRHPVAALEHGPEDSEVQRDPLDAEVAGLLGDAGDGELDGPVLAVPGPAHHVQRQAVLAPGDEAEHPDQLALAVSHPGQHQVRVRPGRRVRPSAIEKPRSTSPPRSASAACTTSATSSALISPCRSTWSVLAGPADPCSPPAGRRASPAPPGRSRPARRRPSSPSSSASRPARPKGDRAGLGDAEHGPAPSRTGRPSASQASIAPGQGLRVADRVTGRQADPAEHPVHHGRLAGPGEHPPSCPGAGRSSRASPGRRTGSAIERNATPPSLARSAPGRLPGRSEQGDQGEQRGQRAEAGQPRSRSGWTSRARGSSGPAPKPTSPNSTSDSRVRDGRAGWPWSPGQEQARPAPRS